MWPQLLESLPHIVKLLPRIDRYLRQRDQSDRRTEDTNHNQLGAMSLMVRNELSHVTVSHAAMYRRIEEQNDKLVELNSEITDARTALLSAEVRISYLELRAARERRLMFLSLGVSAATLATVIIMNFAS